MAAMQEMCATIGLVTQKGPVGMLRLHYPRWVVYGQQFHPGPALHLLALQTDESGHDFHIAAPSE